MDKEENWLIIKTTGQLNWLSSQTRPDLAFDTWYLSVNLNKATYRNAKHSRKILSKAKEKKYDVKFLSLGYVKYIHIQVFSDASLGNIYYRSEYKSVMGSFICLINDEHRICCLSWKSKIIKKNNENCYIMPSAISKARYNQRSQSCDASCYQPISKDKMSLHNHCVWVLLRISNLIRMAQVITSHPMCQIIRRTIKS